MKPSKARSRRVQTARGRAQGRRRTWREGCLRQCGCDLGTVVWWDWVPQQRQIMRFPASIPASDDSSSRVSIGKAGAIQQLK